MSRTYPGTPSFHPLYGAARSVDLPETPRWWHRAGSARCSAQGTTPGPGWTDALVDFRLPHARAPLPDTLPAEDLIEWGSHMPGWSLRGWAFRPEGAPANAAGAVDAVSVVVFTDPDGFRFGFAVSSDKPGEQPQFAGGRFAFLLPTMRFMFLHTFDGMANTAAALAADGFAHPSQAYSLETLRDAVADPRGWFAGAEQGAEGFEHLTIPGPFRPLAASRALVAWAAAGATSYPQVAGWVAAGLDPAEVAGWQDLNNAETNPAALDPETGQATQPWTAADICDWFAALGGGVKRRRLAAGCRAAGLTPAQAARWQDLLAGAPIRNRKAVAAFEDAGWTPEDVAALSRAITQDAHQDPDRWPFSPWQAVPLDVVAEWAFLPAETAAAHLRAGLAPAEIRALAASGEQVTEDTLALLTALRPGCR